jgi:hypothetical protein
MPAWTGFCPAEETKVNLDLRFLSCVAAATVLGLTGCPADDSGDPGADEGGTDSVETTPGTTTDSMTTTDSASSASASSASTTNGTTTTDTTVTDSDASTGSPDPRPNGEMCMSNEECESQMCFLAGLLGGICSNCLTDADCEWGCGLPNPLSDPPLGAECTEGQLGQGCMSEKACMDPEHICATIIDVPGVLTASTCSECGTTADCDGELVCNVSVSVADISGQKTCVEVGSVQDGDFCDLEGDGDAACLNHCDSADLGGIAQFGVCGPCRTVDDAPEGCEAGETCEPPTVDLDGTVTPSQCVAM